MILSSYVLEVPHFILFPFRKNIFRGVSLFRSQILLDRSQLESFHVVNSEEWKQRGSLRSCCCHCHSGGRISTLKFQLDCQNPLPADHCCVKETGNCSAGDWFCNWSLIEVKREKPRGSFEGWVEATETPSLQWLCDPFTGGLQEILVGGTWWIGH